MVSEPLQYPLGHLLSGFRYQATTIYVYEPSPIVLVVRGCVKSLKSDRRWLDYVFISGGNPHLTSRFCKIMLGQTTISKNNSDLYYFVYVSPFFWVLVPLIN